MKNNEYNQRLLLSILPGLSKTARLDILIGDAEDFIALHTDGFLRHDEAITAQDRQTLTALNIIASESQMDEKSAVIEVIKDLNNLRNLFV